MQLKFSNNAITGNLAGKLIHCVVRKSQGTGSPARGEYVIPPPASDAIYGLTALVLPLEQGSTGIAAQPAYLKAGYAQIKAAAVLSTKSVTPRSALAAAASGSSAEVRYLPREVLVLSDKPIAGRNCLVVSLGFADLMLGLEASGGATLTVL